MPVDKSLLCGFVLMVLPRTRLQAFQKMISSLCVRVWPLRKIISLASEEPFVVEANMELSAGAEHVRFGLNMSREMQQPYNDVVV